MTNRAECQMRVWQAPHRRQRYAKDLTGRPWAIIHFDSAAGARRVATSARTPNLVCLGPCDPLCWWGVGALLCRVLGSFCSNSCRT